MLRCSRVPQCATELRSGRPSCRTNTLVEPAQTLMRLLSLGAFVHRPQLRCCVAQVLPQTVPPVGCQAEQAPARSITTVNGSLSGGAA